MAEKDWSIRFDPSAWLADERLGLVSSAAKGLWIDMLCLMHKGDRPGFLQLNGSPLSPQQLARQTGRTVDEVNAQVRELRDAGVFSESGDGIIFSRRMVRDAKRAHQARTNGRRGGNPALRNRSSDNPPDNPRDNPRDKQMGDGMGWDSYVLPSVLDTDEFRKAWDDYADYRRERKLPRLKPKSLESKWAEMAEWGHDRAIQAIRTSIGNGWTGIFEPRDGGGGTHRGHPSQQATAERRAAKTQREGAERVTTRTL